MHTQSYASQLINRGPQQELAILAHRLLEYPELVPHTYELGLQMLYVMKFICPQLLSRSLVVKFYWHAFLRECKNLVVALRH